MPIPLPNLKYLQLEQVYMAHDSMGLLPFLHIPTSATLHLHCDWSDYDDLHLMCSGLSTAWVSAPLSKPSHPPVIESLSIECDAGGDFILRGCKRDGGKPNNERISIFSHAEDQEDLDVVTSTILTCLPLQNLVSLELSCPWAGGFVMRRIFSNLLLLEEIKFCAYAVQVKSFASLLLENALDSSGSAPRFNANTLVPSLHEIILERIRENEVAMITEVLSTALNLRGAGGKGGLQTITLKNCGNVTEDMLRPLRNGPGVSNVICID